MADYDEIYERHGQYYGRFGPGAGSESAEKWQRMRTEAELKSRQLHYDPAYTSNTPDKPFFLGYTDHTGFYDREGKFILDPVIEADMKIAVEKAEEQLFQQTLSSGTIYATISLPEESSCVDRFPGVDPSLKYSVIEMKFAQRSAAIVGAVQTREPTLKADVENMLERWQVNSNVYPVTNAMVEVSKQHRLMTRASKLCDSPYGRKAFHEKAKALEVSPEVVAYDKLLQGLEYAVGLRPGAIPQELREFYKTQLHLPADYLDKLREKERQVGPTQLPEKLDIAFQDLDGALLCKAYADPENWGRSWEEICSLARQTPQETVYATVLPYARATADRVIDPAFSLAEQGTSGMVNRGDLIIIDGKTVREKMFEEYAASGRPPEKFDSFYEKNLRVAANEYVVAGLMTGKRVEAFIPDREGRIPDQPIPITKSGYEPSPLQPETFNAWQRFFSRHGFYKEKVARQAEYERTMAARERVKLTNQGRQWSAMSGTMPHIKGPFVDGWFREHGMTAERLSSQFSVTRSALHSFSVARMLMAGHSAEDIFDPAKLQAEKAAVGREVIEHLREPADLAWAGNTVFQGMRLLREEMDKRTAGLDLGDEKQLFAQKLTSAIAKVSFDLGQERDHCPKEVLSAAAQYMKESGVGGDAAKYYDELHTGSNAASALFDYANRIMERRPLIGGGLGPLSSGGEGRIFTEMGIFEEMKKGFSAARAAQPEKGICEYFTSMDKLLPMMTADTVIASSETFASLMEQLETDQTGQLHQKLGKEIMSGRFQQRMRIENHMETGSFSFDIAPPEKPEDTELRTPGQIQAAKAQKAVQKQNKAPQAGPRL